MSARLDPHTACGCWDGAQVVVPRLLHNRAGLSSLGYRVGAHADFKASLLARISSYVNPVTGAQLGARLTTRDDGDFSIALLDAWASVADVLAFYQERFANESYLRTATERLSVLQLARLIGYRLRPGVSASTYVAFTLDEAPGAPATVRIAPEQQVQSVPQGEAKPQTFETGAEIIARQAWNALRPRLTRPFWPVAGTPVLPLQGTASGIRPGDGLLVLGALRETNPSSAAWDFQLAREVAPDYALGQTVVTLQQPLDEREYGQAKVLAFRKRANIFGYNAPDWTALPRVVKADYFGLDAAHELLPEDLAEWPDFLVLSPGAPAVAPAVQRPLRRPRSVPWINKVDLDNVYPEVTANSWVVLVDGGRCEAYRVVEVEETGRNDYQLRGKTTRLTLSGRVDQLPLFRLRSTTVFVQSEELALAAEPIIDPVYGASIDLDPAARGLVAGQVLAVCGKRLVIRPRPWMVNLELRAPGGLWRFTSPAERLHVLAPPALRAPEGGETPLAPDELIAALAGPPVYISWRVADRSGSEWRLITPNAAIGLERATKEDPEVCEIAAIDIAPASVQPGRDSVTVALSRPLENCYERASVTVNGNVAPADHGETVAQVLGSADAAAAHQRFALLHAPLTHVSSDEPGGAAPALEVRVNDVRWRARDTLYGRGSAERVCALQTDDDGRSSVQFGDGVHGARPPSGRDNVRARYRKGLGLAGNVPAGSLTTVLGGPAGLKAATNPRAASGGADPEVLEDARRNAPLTVLTLERAVSLRDYEDFARGFAGIGKALATWMPEQGAQAVFLTLAGPDGLQLVETDRTCVNLLRALRLAGDAHVRVAVRTYRPARFRLAARVKHHPDYVREKVLAAVEAAVRAGFSFAARGFGQPVAKSEVLAVMQAVEGVEAVDIDGFYRGATPRPMERIYAEMPRIDVDGIVLGAELLTLDPGPLDALKDMP